ncbi:uncharacterized protein LOC132549481 [Ylistrum balloti]|uniref:uncharacterized protein LOC132549481 n=1 Tax=Ylistrum balloti TaxID=509963 RepID=UPI002905E7D8|nr:uncharacterized protein LOC132549481 [Ylistrum balloti]
MEAVFIILIFVGLIYASSLAATVTAKSLLTSLEDQTAGRSECNSYSMLTERIGEEMVDTISEIGGRIDKPKKVVKSALLQEIELSCQVMAMKVNKIKNDIIEECPIHVLTGMHVFGGICTDKGSLTALANELLADYQYVRSACFPAMHPIMDGCKRADIVADKGIVDGLTEYKRIMPEHLHCVFTGIENIDGMSSVCGSTASLKRMAVLFELITYPGPGVTFTMEDFGL